MMNFVSKSMNFFQICVFFSKSMSFSSKSMNSFKFFDELFSKSIEETETKTRKQKQKQNYRKTRIKTKEKTSPIEKENQSLCF